MEKFLKILARMQAGRPVNKDDIRYFMEFTQTVDSDTLSKLQSKLDEGGIASLSGQDIVDLITQLQAQLTQGPYKEQVLQLAQDAEKGRLSQTLTNTLNTIVAGVDIASSLRQIREANKGSRRLPAVQRPVAPGADEGLSQAIRQAQEATFDQSRSLAPAQLQILDQYMRDLNNARTASTGQAGVYGVLAQTAANRRNRSALDLIPMADQVRRADQGRLDNLLAQRRAETQQQYENTASLYPTDLYYNNLQEQRFGDLGATGRTNLRTSLPNFAQFATNAFVNRSVDNKYNQIYNEMLPYGPEAASAAVQARNWIDEYTNPRYASPNRPIA